jgi:hypothetical protein
MKKLFLMLPLVGLMACEGSTPQPIIIPHVDTIIVKPDPIIPTDTTKAWPIKVVTVERNVDKSINMKWEVVTENGVMYYTNHKPQIGDIAFCLGMDEEIVDCECNKLKTNKP